MMTLESSLFGLGSGIVDPKKTNNPFELLVPSQLYFAEANIFCPIFFPKNEEKFSLLY